MTYRLTKSDKETIYYAIWRVRGRRAKKERFRPAEFRYKGLIARIRMGGVRLSDLGDD